MDDAGDSQTRQVIWYVQFLFHTPSVYIIRCACVTTTVYTVVSDHLFPIHVVIFLQLTK